MSDILTDLSVTFATPDRYSPFNQIQLAEPVFIWESFRSYPGAGNQELWGDNCGGVIDITGGLNLHPTQMIWSLYRFGFGIAEFRWAHPGNPTDPNIDQYWGFGDVSEGFCAGYRLCDKHLGEGVQLYALTCNYGQGAWTKIPWSADYQHARFFVEWSRSSVAYVINTPTLFSVVASHVDGSPGLEAVGVPRERMEISVQNYAGASDFSLPDHQVIKYDKANI